MGNRIVGSPVALMMAGRRVLRVTLAVVLMACLLWCVEAGASSLYPGQPAAPYWSPSKLLAWDPATDPNAEYNRSAVPLATRFSNPALNLNSHARVGEARVASLATLDDTFSNPCQGSDWFWRSGHEGFIPTYWQYQDLLVVWHGTPEYCVTAPHAAAIDAGHRNGVRVYGTIFFDASSGQTLMEFTQKSGAKFPVADKLIQVANYFGFDGYFINCECTVSSATAQAMRDMLAYIKANSNVHIQWYDSLGEDGSLSYQNELNSGNDAYFNAVDSMFLNYWWDATKLSNTRTYAQNLGRNPYDNYTGLNVQECLMEGINLPQPLSYLDLNETVPSNKDNQGFPMYWYQRITDIFPEGQAHKASLAFYRPEWTKRFAANNAEAYSRDNYFWVGPNGDPANTTTAHAWKGLAHYIAAASPIKSIPFATSFNTGHGAKYAINGSNLSARSWVNLSLQDILPTWRWRVSSSGTKLSPELNWDESYYGGSSLKLSGTLDAVNDIKLYQTSLPVSSNTLISIAYKNGTNGLLTYARLALSFEEAPATMVYLNDLGATTNAGWNTKAFSLAAYSGKKIATLGLRCTPVATVSGYQLYVGQLAVYNGAVGTPNPPGKVTLTDIFRSNESTASLRMRWTNSTSSVYAYNVYQRHADNTLTYVGSTPNNVYFVLEVKRLNNEAASMIEVEALGPDFGASARSTANFDWQTIPVMGNDRYFDVNGSTAGFGRPAGSYMLSSAVWNPNATGDGVSLPIDGSRMLYFGASGSDLAGTTFVVEMNINGPWAGLRINSTNANVTLAGSGYNAYLAGATTWTVASGSTLNVSVPNMNYNGSPLTLAGGGTINVTTELGCNSGTAITENDAGAGLTVNLSAARTGWGGGFILRSGNLNIVNAAAKNALGAGTVILGGGKLDNRTGAALTLQDMSGYTLAGGFTFGGSGALSLGTPNVTLASNSVVTVHATTLTIPGIISGTNSLGKSGAGTLFLGGVNTYSGATTVSNGTLVLSGAGSIAGSTNITVLTNAQITVANTANVLNDSAVMMVAPGGRVTLTNGVVETVGQLFIGGQPAATGTWGAANCRWTNTAVFAGAGILRVTSTPATVFTISASAGMGGAISPCGAVQVGQGSNCSFTISPSNYYHVATVLVDGVSVGSSNSYMFSNVVTNRAISASFAENFTTGKHPTKVRWLNTYYGVTNYDAVAEADTDGDGMSAWQEYIAGTDPTNRQSVMKVAVSFLGGSNQISWVGGNTGLPPFTVRVSTDLSKGESGWATVTNIPRSANGTNTWIDQNAKTSPQKFYKIVATNSP